MRSIGLYVFVSAYCVAVFVRTAGCSHLETLALFSCTALTAMLAARRVRASVWRAIVLAIVAMLLAMARIALVPRGLPEAFHPLVGTQAHLEGVVVALPDMRETSERITVEVSVGKATTRIIASVPRFPRVHVSDRVQLSGKLAVPAPFATDGGRTFAYDDFLRKDGVYAVMQPARVTVIERSGRAWLRTLRVLEAMRDALMRALADVLPEPESSLAAGLLVGGKQGLGPRLIDSFTAAGMLQIIVLSGYNVMVVANAILGVFRRLEKGIAATLALSGIALFVALAGAGSSALRAGCMAAIAIIARVFGKRYAVLRALAASVFLLAFLNPLMLAYDPGFQFSCIATLGLVIGVPLIAPRLVFLRSPFVIEAVATTLAAEIALLPYLLWQTGNLSLVSVIANVIAMPAVPMAMAAVALGALAAFPLAAFDPSLLPLAGLPAYLPLAYLIKVATLDASLPYALVIVPAFPFWAVPLSYAALVASAIHLARPLRPGSGARPRSS